MKQIMQTILVLFLASPIFAVEYAPEIKAEVHKIIDDRAALNPRELLKKLATLLVNNVGQLNPEEPEDRKIFNVFSSRFYSVTPDIDVIAFFARHHHFLNPVDNANLAFSICKEVRDRMPELVYSHVDDVLSLLKAPNAPLLCSTLGELVSHFFSQGDVKKLTHSSSEYSAMPNSFAIQQTLIKEILTAQNEWTTRAIFLIQVYASLPENSSLRVVVEKILFPKFVVRDLQNGLASDPIRAVAKSEDLFSKTQNYTHLQLDVLQHIADFFSDERISLTSRNQAFEASLPFLAQFKNAYAHDQRFKNIRMRYLKYKENLNQTLMRTEYDELKKISIDYINKNFISELERSFEVIMSDIPLTKGKKINRPSPQQLRKVAFNHDGYEKLLPSFDCGKRCEKTLPLVLPQGSYTVDGRIIDVETDIPIGYNIHFPKGEVIGIFVDVYGGGIDDGAFNKPMVLSAFQDYLLSEGIVVVTTNLWDTLAHDGKQDAMSQNFHGIIQLSINRLHQGLQQPSMLISDDDAKILSGKKIFLFGQSFGGMIAVRHAELFPDNFAGYISHDGGLSSEIGVAGDLGYMKGRGTAPDEIEARAWLTPMTEPLPLGETVDRKIATIKKPILLLHNFDDNNVNVLVSIRWYQRAIESIDANLVRLVITKKGNPLSPEDPLGTKGHLIPTSKREQVTYRNAIMSFMRRGEHSLDEQQQSKDELRAFELYALRNFPASTLEEQFLSIGYRWYQNQQQQNLCRKLPKSWDYLSADKISLVNIYYLLVHLDKLEKNDGLKNELTLMATTLVDDKIDKALRSHFDQVAAYSAQLNGVPRSLMLDALESIDLNNTPAEPARTRRLRSGKEIAVPAVDEKPGLRSNYRSLLMNDDAERSNAFRRHLLWQLYLANPELITKLTEKYETTTTVVDAMHEAIKLLDAKIAEGQHQQCSK